MTKGERMPHAVIAAAKDEAQFQAVEVRKQDNVVEVLWAKSLPADSQTWTAFATTCGVTAGHDGHDKTLRKHSASVVGLDSTGVAFYRITAPAVEPQEMASIVRMQAESLLPLPPDQIEVAWRTTPATNGNVDITIAAARRDYLHKFAGSVHGFHPGHIVLSCEGTAWAWYSVFSDRQREAVVVSLGAQNAQVFLVQNGQVAQAAMLGSGTAQLQESDPAAEPAGTSSGETPAANPQSPIRNPQSIEWFAHDLRTVLGSFGWNEASPWPIFVLSDGGEALNRLVEELNAVGIAAKVSVPEPRNLRLPSGFRTQDIYEYRTSLGLSLLALEKPSTALNLFERIAEQEEQEKASTAWRTVWWAAAFTVAALIALVVTVYFTDAAAARRWTALVTRPDFEAERQHQVLLKTVARHRPDMLELLACVNAGKNDGIVLDSLHFKKGQTVTLVGTAGNTEQMWTFEKNLRAQRDLTSVTNVNPTQDSKTKKVKFTITFSYKTFSKKDAVL